MCFVGAGAILSVGLLRSIQWAKMEKRFDVDGGVSGGTVLKLIWCITKCDVNTNNNIIINAFQLM